MVAYYSEGYFTGKVHGAHQDYLAEEREKLVDFREKLRSIRRHAPGGRLLDVGCATGFSLFAAQQLGYQPEGVELSDWAVDHNRSGCKIWRGDLLEVSCTPPYDLITLWDVLEHLRRPNEAFSKLSKMLSAGGILACTIPDPSSLYARLAGRSWSVLNPEEHYLFCTPRLLRSWLARWGLTLAAELPERRYFTLGKLAQKVLSPAAAHLDRLGLGERLLSLRLPYKRLMVFRRET